MDLYTNVQDFVITLAERLNSDLPTLVETYILTELPTEVDEETGETKQYQAGNVNKRPCIVKVTEGDDEGIWIWDPENQKYIPFSAPLGEDGKIPSKYIPQYALNDVFSYTASSGDLSDVAVYLRNLSTDPKPEKGDIVIVNFDDSTEYNGTYLITAEVNEEFTEKGLTKIQYNVANDNIAGIVYTDKDKNSLTTTNGLLSLYLKDNSGLDATAGLSITCGDGVTIASGAITLVDATTGVIGGVKLANSVSSSESGVTSGSQVANYVSEQIKDLASTSYVDSAKSDAESYTDEQVKDLASTSYVDAAKSEAESYTDEQIKANIPDLSPYAKTADVETNIATAKEEAITEANAYTDSKVTSITDGLKFWTGTQTEYDNLSEKDPSTLYIITE